LRPGAPAAESGSVADAGCVALHEKS